MENPSVDIAIWCLFVEYRPYDQSRLKFIESATEWTYLAGAKQHVHGENRCSPSTKPHVHGGMWCSPGTKQDVHGGKRCSCTWHKAART